jgi:VanZ family protein
VISLWLPVALWMGAIYWGASLPLVPGPVALFSDTVLHIAGYSGLALLTLRATARGRWSGVTTRALALAFVIAVIHGLTVEWEQMYIPSRFAEWRDVGNDAIGAFGSLVAAWAWSKMKSPT